jgi:hypothetical protein
MHSGGGSKEKWAMIYIEAPEEEAKVIFYNRFGHSADRVSCTCCGEDYSVSSNESLAELTGFHRGCRSIESKKRGGKWIKSKRTYYEKDENPPSGRKWSIHSTMNEYTTLKEYVKNKDVLVIRNKDIKAKERVGTAPKQGYVWCS